MYLPHIWKYISVQIDPYASSKPHILWFQWRNDHREVMILILFRNLLIFNGIMNIGEFILKVRIPSYGWIEFDLRKSPRSMPNKETKLVIKWKSNILKEWTLHLHNIFPISTNRNLDFWLREIVKCKDNTFVEYFWDLKWKMHTYFIIIGCFFQWNLLIFFEHGVLHSRYKVKNICHWVPQTCGQILSTSHNTFAYSRIAVIESYSWIFPIYHHAQFNIDSLSFIIYISDTLNCHMKIYIGNNYNLKKYIE